MTRNEASRLPRTLASIPSGAAAFVLDADSTDGTVEVAQQSGAIAEVRAWVGFSDARRYALSRVRTPWTFMLDADETLDDELRAAVLAAGDGFDGYVALRTTIFCGRPMVGGGWGREPLLRLFRTDGARLESHPASGGTADLHERWIVDGPVDTLSGTLLHDSYPTLAVYKEKFDRYTSIEAAGLTPSAVGVAATAAKAALRAPWLFFARRGFLDGWRGAFVAAMSAAYPVAAMVKAMRRR